jgi:hypothetical protein
VFDEKTVRLKMIESSMAAKAASSSTSKTRGLSESKVPTLFIRTAY